MIRRWWVREESRERVGPEKGAWSRRGGEIHWAKGRRSSGRMRTGRMRIGSLETSGS